MTTELFQALAAKRRFRETLAATQEKLGPLFDGLVIVGGGALEIHGIRDAGDFDAVATPEAWAEIWNLFGPCEENYIGGSSRCILLGGDTQIFNMIDLPAPPLAQQRRYVMGAETLFQRSIIVDGLRVQTLSDLLDMKRGLGRSKDVEDCTLIAEYVAKRLRG